MPEEPNTPVRTIGARVADLRARRGYTATELGEKLDAAGVPWNRFTVKGLESGKRQNVTVTELLALARVLNVAPVHLLVSPLVDDDAEYHVTPNETVTIKKARAWIRGYEAILGGRVAEFGIEGPDSEHSWIYTPAGDDPQAVLATVNEMAQRLEAVKAQLRDKAAKGERLELQDDGEQEHQEAPER